MTAKLTDAIKASFDEWKSSQDAEDSPQFVDFEAGYRAAIAALPKSVAEEYDVMCPDCGGSGADRKDNNYGCSTCGSSGFVQKILYAEAPIQSAHGWQPIETAPKIGAHLAWEFGKRPYVIVWLDADHPEAEGPGWHEHWNFDLVTPTHWMPLPAAPGVIHSPQPAALADDVRDAERYRWLRDATGETPLRPAVFCSETFPDIRLRFDFPTLISYDSVGNQITLDEAIDAAIAAAKGEK